MSPCPHFSLQGYGTLRRALRPCVRASVHLSVIPSEQKRKGNLMSVEDTTSFKQFSAKCFLNMITKTGGKQQQSILGVYMYMYTSIARYIFNVNRVALYFGEENK